MRVRRTRPRGPWSCLRWVRRTRRLCVVLITCILILSVLLNWSSSIFDHNKQTVTIGIGCAITTRGAQAERYLPKVAAPQAISDSIYFTTFLPSFCSTSTSEFHYHFAVAYDFDDPLMSYKLNIDEFQWCFHSTVRRHCPKSMVYSLSLVKCSYSKQPARAQNEAMMLLYLNNVDYLYRINDDTTMRTHGWVNLFIDALKAFDPPNVGVVGPETKARHHRKFLTYDFVHKTHVDIFGFYYPHVFVDWYADQWIDRVYQPGRSRKVSTVIHEHNFNAGQRYIEHTEDEAFKNFTVYAYKGMLSRYITKAGTEVHEMLPTRTNNVISMWLWENQPRYVMGAIRNAQLASIIYPGWTLRVHIPVVNHIMNIPANIARKLISLGADVRLIPTARWEPEYWTFSILNESMVDALIMRDADMRLTDRDASAVAEWLSTDTPVHCIRDSPKSIHAPRLMTENLLGVQPKLFKAKTGLTITQVVDQILVKSFSHDIETMSSQLLDVLKRHTICHVYRSKRTDTGIMLLPFPRQCGEYIGQKFNATGHSLNSYPRTHKCQLLYGVG